MENYVYELYKKNGILELEKAFEENFSNYIKASIYMAPSQKQLVVVLADREFNLIKAYETTDFNCMPIMDCYLPKRFEHMHKSEKRVIDSDVRKFYLRFMKNEFETYYEDYKAFQLENVEKDLNY